MSHRRWHIEYPDRQPIKVQLVIRPTDDVSQGQLETLIAHALLKKDIGVDSIEWDGK